MIFELLKGWAQSVEFLTTTVEWFLFKSIYGATIVAAIVYGLLKVLLAIYISDKSGRVSGLVALPPAAIVFLSFVLLAPSYVRSNFEKDTRLRIEANRALRLVSTTNWGSLTEPYTLFTDCCVGFFEVVTPDPMTDGNFSDQPTAFRRFGIRYEHDPLIQLHVVSCGDREFELSMPDSSGVFRIHDHAVELSDEGFELYCESDWSSEMNALREQAGL